MNSHARHLRRLAFAGMTGALFVAFALSAALVRAVRVDPVSAAFEPAPEVAPVLGAPIDNAGARVTKKPFGLLLVAGHSPVENDRFSGYHVGVDFETFAEEQEIDVPVYAVCDGPLLFKTWANGYGGVAVQSCRLGDEDVQITYGHLRLDSVVLEAGEAVARGAKIAVLGTGRTEETDGVRKHLHLGVHKGSATDLRGYVQDQELVSNWLDVLPYLST